MYVSDLCYIGKKIDFTCSRAIKQVFVSFQIGNNGLAICDPAISVEMMQKSFTPVQWMEGSIPNVQ
jgi:hypothetical protein